MAGNEENAIRAALHQLQKVRAALMGRRQVEEYPDTVDLILRIDQTLVQAELDLARAGGVATQVWPETATASLLRATARLGFLVASAAALPELFKAASDAAEVTKGLARLSHGDTSTEYD